MGARAQVAPGPNRGGAVPWLPHAERQELAESIRALVDAVVRTGADAVALVEARRTVDALTAQLADPTYQRSLQISSDSPRAAFSLVGGRAHPFAPQLHLEPTEADGCQGTVVLGACYEGGPGLVHGGVLGLLFDHAMAYAAAVASTPRGPLMTGTMSVSFHRPTPLYVPLVVSAYLERADGRKVHVVGEIRVEDEVTARAKGLFIRISDDVAKAVYSA